MDTYLYKGYYIFKAVFNEDSGGRFYNQEDMAWFITQTKPVKKNLSMMIGKSAVSSRLYNHIAIPNTDFCAQVESLSEGKTWVDIEQYKIDYSQILFLHRAYRQDSNWSIG